MAVGDWISRRRGIEELNLYRKLDNGSKEEWEIFGDSVLPFLVDSPSSKCEEVNTLGAAGGSVHGELGAYPEQGLSIQAILTRRLGLIVGCCMGIVVFIVLVSVLGYLKVKKQRHAIKRDQPLPPEYISYRHFSIQSGETGGGGGGGGGCGTQSSGHPPFITNANTTTFTS